MDAPIGAILSNNLPYSSEDDWPSIYQATDEAYPDYIAWRTNDPVYNVTLSYDGTMPISDLVG